MDEGKEIDEFLEIVWNIFSPIINGITFETAGLCTEWGHSVVSWCSCQHCNNLLHLLLVGNNTVLISVWMTVAWQSLTLDSAL